MGDAPFVLGLVIALAVLVSAGLARLAEVPAPVFLVIAGLLASFVPGTPSFHLAPDVVFYVFLPPLLYYAAFLSSPRALRANWLPIGLLAVGLVLATTVITALVSAQVVAGLTLGSAFILGSVVGPTDPVAATSVMSRLGAPRRLSVVLEGESLVNDGIALVLFGLAVSASTTGTFSVLHGVVRFVESVAGGIAWGVVVGYAVVLVRRRISDAGIEITLSLFTPFVAYVPADRAHVSGVLAAVTAGLFIGNQSEGLFRPGVRLSARAFWDQLDFLLTSVLFVLLGLQFRSVVSAQTGRSALDLAVEAVVVSAIVIAVRMVWQFVVPRRIWTIGRDQGTAPATWREKVLLGWGGMRGAISLAAALAVPIGIDPHTGGSQRATILYLTFAVIIATLVIEGVTLPWVIRALGLTGAGAGSPREREAKLAMVEAALKRADEIEEEDRVPPDIVAALRERFEQERRMVEHEVGAAEGDEAEREQSRLDDYHWLRRELMQAQRAELRRRRRSGALHEAEVRRLRRDLDLRESLLD